MYKQLRNKHITKITSFILLPVFIIFIGLGIHFDSILCYGLAILVLLIIYLTANVWFKRHFFDEYLDDKDKRKKIYEFFSNKEMKDGLYYDAIIWLWWDLKSKYKEKHTQEDTDDEINALKLFIYEDVRSIAIKKRERFQELCSELAKEGNDNERAKKLVQEYWFVRENFDDNTLISKKISFKIKDISIFIYFAVIAIHIVGCIISDNFWENFLFYIPSDIIPILIFYNLINDKKHV